MPLDAQDISSLVTLALGGATVWLAVETRRMANAAKASIELQGTPYVAVSAIDLKILQGADLVGGTNVAARFALCLANPGQVLVTYEVDSIEITLDGTPQTDLRFDNRGGVIHPGNNTQFFYPWLRVAYPLKPGMTAVISFRISYWATTLRLFHLDARLRYVLQSVEPAHGEWVFLDGPTYA